MSCPWQHGHVPRDCSVHCEGNDGVGPFHDEIKVVAPEYLIGVKRFRYAEVLFRPSFQPFGIHVTSIHSNMECVVDVRKKQNVVSSAARPRLKFDSSSPLLTVSRLHAYTNDVFSVPVSVLPRLSARRLRVRLISLPLSVCWRCRTLAVPC